MSKTRHMHQRMGQRGITKRMIDLVLNYGVYSDEKCTLDRKNIDALVGEMDRLRKQLVQLRDKGGLTVVEHDDVQITAYRVDSYNRRCLV